MKKFISLALLAASLAVSARAALILGAEGGYLIDSEEEYFTARAGYQFAGHDTLTQEFGLELGYSEQKDAGAKVEYLPLTLNYRIEGTAANRFGYYVGAGAGIAFLDLSGYGFSASDSPFAAQAFAGLTYQATPNAKLHLGVKYIWIDDIELFHSSFEVGDDIALTAGLSIKF